MKKRSYLALLVLVAVLVLANVLMAILPATATRRDQTPGGLYTVSDTTRGLLRSLEEDVTVYIVARGKGRLPLLQRNLIAQYSSLSRHVRFETVNTADEDDVAAMAEYTDMTNLSSYSMIVVGPQRYRVIDFGNCEYYTIEGLGQISVAQYMQLISDQQAILYCLQLGIDLSAITADHLALEEALSGAIEYVSAPTVPHLYLSASSAEPTGYLSDLLRAAQPEWERLDGQASLSANTAPLMIYAPTADLTDRECAAVKAYLASGGYVLMVTSPENTTMKNLMSIGAMFGLEPVTGTLREGNANRYQGTPNCLIPAVNAQHDITYAVYSYGYTAPLCPDAHGIRMAAQAPAGVSAATLFATSDATYAVDAEGNETDVGAVSLGVAAADTSTGAQLVWLSTASALTDEAVALGQQGAGMMVYTESALRYLSRSYVSQLGDIDPIDLSEGSLQITDTTLWLSLAVFVLAIPAAVLVFGIVTRIRRAKQ